MSDRRVPSPHPARNRLRRIIYLAFLLLVPLVPLFLAGCAAPGEPTERKPPVPTAITDLAASQQGNDVILSFTLPQETVMRHPLKQAPEIEIYRDLLPPPAAGSATPTLASPKNATLLFVIPSAMVGQYAIKNHVRYADPLAPDDLTRHDGWMAVYGVRTRMSMKKSSADSNPAGVRIYPAPDPIDDLKAEVTHHGIVLTWTPPQKTPVGPARPIAGYRIYRSEAALDAVPAVPSANAAQTPKLKAPLARIGDTPDNSFTDVQVEFGTTYLYSVRSLSQHADISLESADSNLVVVTPRDTFPPTAPEGLVVVLVPAQGQEPAHLDLSWAISPETDIAGYNVYRSEQQNAPGTHLNPGLLLTPAFRDMNVVPGHRYFYTVTAVDRAGNESPASVPASGGVQVESQTSP
jgi:hypothetical protein